MQPTFFVKLYLCFFISNKKSILLNPLKLVSCFWCEDQPSKFFFLSIHILVEYDSNYVIKRTSSFKCQFSRLRRRGWFFYFFKCINLLQDERCWIGNFEVQSIFLTKDTYFLQSGRNNDKKELEKLKWLNCKKIYNKI